MNTKIGILFITLSCLFLTSCKKEPHPEKKSFRLKTIIYQNHNTNLGKTTYSYDNSRVVSIDTYEVNSLGHIDTIICTVEYEGNTITLITRNNESPGTLNYIQKCIQVYSKGLLITSVMYNYISSQWTEISRNEYQYSNNRLIENTIISLSDTLKRIVMYDHDQLKEIQFYTFRNNTHSIVGKTAYSYLNNLLSNRLYSELKADSVWENVFKNEYSYSGRLKTADHGYNWALNEHVWQDEGYILYSFNANGLLIQESNDDGNITSYEYETGIGNASLLATDPLDALNGNPIFRNSVKTTLNSAFYNKKTQTK